MSFTPKELARVVVASGFEARVLFEHDSDPRQNFQQCLLCADDADLAAKADARAKQAAVIGKPPGTVIDPPTVKPPPGPTPADVARQAWQVAYDRVARLKRARDLNVTAITAQALTDAQTTLNGLPYLASYEDFV